jgi:transposase-like protein
MQSTSSALEGGEILRRDKRGRVWTKPERREALLEEYGKSGLSGAQFARLSGLKYSTLQNWLQQRRRRRRAVEAGSGEVRLLEAVVESGGAMESAVGASVGGLLIELPGGSRMRVETPVQLRLAAELLLMMGRQPGRPPC